MSAAPPLTFVWSSSDTLISRSFTRSSGADAGDDAILSAFFLSDSDTVTPQLSGSFELR